jgi:hypothetical protein
LVKQFEREPGKVSTLIKLGKIVIRTEWSETVSGEFPITEWRSFPLQIPSGSFKKYIVSQFSSGLKTNHVKEEDLEVINLPVYIGEDICDVKVFEAADSKTTESITKTPIVTIASKVCGQCSHTGMETQFLSVLPVWGDDSSIVLELEWYEGNPMEGDVNPEWHVQASPRLSVREGLQKLKESSRSFPPAENLSYCIYVNPTSLGTHLFGQFEETACQTPSKTWNHAWKFDTHEKMLGAIDLLSETLCQAF